MNEELKTTIVFCVQLSELSVQLLDSAKQLSELGIQLSDSGIQLADVLSYLEVTNIEIIILVVHFFHDVFLGCSLTFQLNKK